MGSKDLISMIDFIYNGQVSIRQDYLADFLVLANELQLKGLTGDVGKYDQNQAIEKIITSENSFDIAKVSTQVFQQSFKKQESISNYTDTLDESHSNDISK